MHSPVRKNLRLIDSCFIIISSHFSASYINIFYKNEVQSVILRCLTCLYLNWFKCYDTKRQKRKNSKNAKLSKLVNSCKNIFKSFHSFLWISQWKIEIERLNISHFKAFGIINLQYEIRICQIIYNKVWFDLTCIKRYNACTISMFGVDCFSLVFSMEKSTKIINKFVTGWSPNSSSFDENWKDIEIPLHWRILLYHIFSGLFGCSPCLLTRPFVYI